MALQLGLNHNQLWGCPVSLGSSSKTFSDVPAHRAPQPSFCHTRKCLSHCLVGRRSPGTCLRHCDFAPLQELFSGTSFLLLLKYCWPVHFVMEYCCQLERLGEPLCLDLRPFAVKTVGEAKYDVFSCILGFHMHFLLGILY